MWKKLRSVALYASTAAVGVSLSVACASNNAEPNPTLPADPVAIESISPSSGTLGTAIIIRGTGFTSVGNDVAFNRVDTDSQERFTHYLNGLSSPDGKTLRFRLPDNWDVLLSACAYSQLRPNEACPDIGYLLTTGDFQISVVNESGESNSVALAVFGAADPDPDVKP